MSSLKTNSLVHESFSKVEPISVGKSNALSSCINIHIQLRFIVLRMINEPLRGLCVPYIHVLFKNSTLDCAILNILSSILKTIVFDVKLRCLKIYA